MNNDKNDEDKDNDQDDDEDTEHKLLVQTCIIHYCRGITREWNNSQQRNIESVIINTPENSSCTCASVEVIVSTSFGSTPGSLRNVFKHIHLDELCNSVGTFYWIWRESYK